MKRDLTTRVLVRTANVLEGILLKLESKQAKLRGQIDRTNTKEA